MNLPGSVQDGDVGRSTALVRVLSPAQPLIDRESLALGLDDQRAGGGASELPEVSWKLVLLIQKPGGIAALDLDNGA